MKRVKYKDKVYTYGFRTLGISINPNNSTDIELIKKLEDIAKKEKKSVSAIIRRILFKELDNYIISNDDIPPTNK